MTSDATQAQTADATQAQTADALAGTLKRTEIQRGSSSIPGREIVQVRTEIPVGVASGWHIHPGEEVPIGSWPSAPAPGGPSRSPARRTSSASPTLPRW